MEVSVRVYRDKKGYIRAESTLEGETHIGSSDTVAGALRNLAFMIQSQPELEVTLLKKFIQAKTT